MIDPKKARQNQFAQALSQARMQRGPATTQPRPAGMPALPGAKHQGQVGANFQLGTTQERLQQQLARANSEIQRRGGTAPNNEARKRMIEAELAKRGGGAPGNVDTPLPPPGQGGGPQQPGSGTAPGANPGGASQVAPADSQNNPFGMLNGVYNAATNGTINEYNTAANRLRERVDAMGEANMEQAKSRQLGRGFGTSGAMDQAAYQVGANTQNAYAQGLNDLSMQFENQRQQGLQTALGAGQSALNYRSQGEDRQSTERIAGEGRALQERLQQRDQQFQGGENALERALRQTLLGQQQSFEGGQNQAQRDLQKYLGELGEKNGNWRASLQGLLSLLDSSGTNPNASSIDIADLLGLGSGSSGALKGPNRGGI